MPSVMTNSKPIDLANVAQLPDEALLNVEVVAKLLSVSQRQIWRLAKDGLFVRPVALGASRRWRLGAIRAWLRAHEVLPPISA